MRYSTRTWAYRAAPVVALGLLGLMLLPGAPGRPSSVPAATPAAPAAPSVPQFLRASIVVPTPAPEAKPAAPAAAAPALVTASVTPDASAPALSPAVPTAPLHALWSDYFAAPATAQAPAAQAGSSDGRVGAVAVNARSGPSSGTPSRFVLAAGEAVKIAESNGNWVHVYRQDGSDGWVYGRYLAGNAAAPAARPAPTVATASTAPPRSKPAAADRPSAANAALVGRVAAIRSPVPVRSAPGSSVMFVLSPGERVRIADSRGSWLRVITEDGYSGWIPG